LVESIKIVRQGLAKYAPLKEEGDRLRADYERRKESLAPPERKQEEAKLNAEFAKRLGHRVEPPRHLPQGEAYLETECPRGAMGFYVVGAAGKQPVPLRVRAKSSSFCNLSITNEICRNCLIADVPAIVGSIDIVMGEIDR